MEIGPRGHLGQHAVQLVDQEIRLIPEVAAIHSPLMADLIALEMKLKYSLVVFKIV